MALEAMAQRIGEVTSRRRVLARFGAAGLASAAYIGGVDPPSAQALCRRHGCDFCNCPGCSGYTCAWCWWGRCHRHSNGVRYQHRCCEGYGPVAPQYCNGQCHGGQVCSFYNGRRRC